MLRLVPAMILAGAVALPALAEDKKKADAEPASEIKVRSLKVKQVPAGKGGGKEATVYESKAALEKAMGKDLAAELDKQVKFPGEAVVAVSYSVSGPPYPKLEHEVKKKDKTVEFYYTPNKGPSGLALKLGLEFFAVPKGAKAKYIGAKK
jgi:hypothetical protein